MKRRIVRLAAIAMVIAAPLACGAARPALQADDEQAILLTLPKPPPLASDTTPSIAESLAVAKRLMAPPPPRAACITPEARNAALSGAGCSCTCDEYARKPVSDRCDIACFGHYSCWGPIPSDAELQDSYDLALAGVPADQRTPLASLTVEEREALRGGLRARQGLAWDQARLCER